MLGTKRIKRTNLMYEPLGHTTVQSVIYRLVVAYKSVGVRRVLKVAAKGIAPRFESRGGLDARYWELLQGELGEMEDSRMCI